MLQIIVPQLLFHGQIYNPLELIESDDLPILDQLTILDANRRKRFVLGCIDFALGFKEKLD